MQRSAVADLSAVELEGFGGQVVRPDDADYDEARAVYNGMIDRRPGLIARCSGVADVVDAVNVAREKGLLVAVRCGGHSVAGNAVCDDGILLDLSGMKSVLVDPAARTVRANGGVLWGEFDRETQVFGLATAPKFPLPPRMPQNRSSFSSSLATRTRPSAVTTCAEIRLSQARPYFGEIQA